MDTMDAAMMHGARMHDPRAMNAMPAPPGADLV